jgi:hypothetical protein
LMTNRCAQTESSSSGSLSKSKSRERAESKRVSWEIEQE